MRKAGFEVVEDFPTTPTMMSEAIERHRKQVDLVVVGGGDGTLNSAAAGIIATGLPMGILPMGTANDLARTLNLPTDIDEASAIIAAGKTRRIDVGKANDNFYFNVASVGISVEIAKSLNKETKRFWGSLAYAKAAFSVIFRAKPFWAEIRSASGNVQVKTLQIAVGNGRFYGGGMVIAPDAAIDDRRLNLYSLECRRWWRLLWLAPAIWIGNPGQGSDVRTMSADEFEIRTHRSLPVNADGELVTQTPANFRVVPAAVSVFVP